MGLLGFVGDFLGIGIEGGRCGLGGMGWVCVGWVNLVMSWSIGLDVGLGAVRLGSGSGLSSFRFVSFFIFIIPSSLGTGFRQAIILAISFLASFSVSSIAGFTGRAGFR